MGEGGTIQYRSEKSHWLHDNSLVLNWLGDYRNITTLAMTPRYNWLSARGEEGDERNFDPFLFLFFGYRWGLQGKAKQEVQIPIL